MKTSPKQDSPAASGTNVFIDSVSCERRELDTQKITTYLQQNNYTVVHDLKKADYIILMTCGATKSIADISFNLIEKYKEFDAEIIVAGCIPETHTRQLEKIFTGKTLSTKNLDKIDELFPQMSIKFQEIPDMNIRWNNENVSTFYGIVKAVHNEVNFVKRIDDFLLDAVVKKIFGKNFPRTFPFDRLIPDYGKYYVSISRGCVHNCTYCVIRKGVGPLHSKPVEQCVKEISCGLQQGYRKFVLDADDIGPYGVDIGSTLPALLTRISAIDQPFSLKISHTHPKWIIKYGDEINEILKQEKIMNLFVSIQSGNDRVLDLMGRPYSIKQLLETISSFKKTNPGLEIGADLIVGFPTETEEEFLDTLQMFDHVHFDYGVFFPFSCHEGTKASTMEPKISKQEINRRMKTTLRFLKKNNYFSWRFHTGAISFYTR